MDRPGQVCSGADPVNDLLDQPLGDNSNSWLTPSLYAKVKDVPRISSKHQVTLPVETLEAAGLRAGDEVLIEAEGEDRIVVHRASPDLASALGVFDGLYEPGYLEKLRAEERA